MGIGLTEQLVMFCRSILLGGVLGLLYDLLRALRMLGGRVWGGVLDGAYCVLSASLLFFFVMAGDGELRLFFLAGAVGGAVLFFCLLSPVLRPVWDFWLEILLSPFRLTASAGKKCCRSAKKFFLCGRNAVTIGFRHWMRKRSAKKGDGGDGQAGQTAKQGETGAE